jgi:hypothetical protein
MTLLPFLVVAVSWSLGELIAAKVMATAWPFSM